MRIRHLLAALAILAIAAPVRADAPPAYERGELERSAIDEALAEFGLTEASDPWDRPVCEVHVRAFPIFLPEDFLPTWLNVFHRVTRERVIRRSMTIAPGDTFSQSAFEDAERALRNGSVFLIAAVVPVQNPDPDAACIDALIVTRDVWSLRINGSIETSGETITSLYLGASESNLFGSADTLAVGFQRSQGAWRMGPTYVSRNLAGSRLVLYESFDVILDRERGGIDGTANTFQLTQPLYATHVRWGWALTASHDFSLRRRYTGNQLDYVRIENVLVPERYRSRTASGNFAVTRSWGTTLKTELVPGFSTSWSDFEPVPYDPAIPASVLEKFEATRLPRSGLSIGPSLTVRSYRNEYFRLVDYQTYGIAEELRQGHLFEMTFVQSEPGLGADERAFSVGTTLSWRVPIGDDAFAAAGVTHYVRTDRTGVTDLALTGSLRLVTPRVFAGRFVLRALVAEHRRNDANSIYAIGGDNGLRGYPVGFLKGSSALQANVEWRSLPVRIGRVRLGGVASMDVGATWEPNEFVEYYPSVGVGARIVIPLLGTIVRAADLSFPLVGRVRPVFSVGVDQAF